MQLQIIARIEGKKVDAPANLFVRANTTKCKIVPIAIILHQKVK